MMTFAVIGFLLAAFATANFWSNLQRFQTLQKLSFDSLLVPVPSVSVLIPARDEEQSIAASVLAALASREVKVEVVVLDDHSSDRTASIVQGIAALDARVRYQTSCPLPAGWNGKQHACFLLADLAGCDRMLFLDADVRLGPDAIAKLAAYQDVTSVALLSAFPHQETGTWLEKWIIPLMHYILLCYLPFSRMRSSNSTAYASGCGQLFMTRKDDYRKAGTHKAIAASRHDGLKLPKAYRLAGLSTDVVDGSAIASCRMYQSTGEVIFGVLKNATEGIANVRLIVPFTILLVGGSILPIMTAAYAVIAGRPVVLLVSLSGVLLGHFPRAIAALRFRQPLAGVVMHSLSVTVFILLQWFAMVQSTLGYKVAWRGRR